VHPYALQVLAELFGGGSTSRLYQSLVVKQKLASSAYASYNPTAVDFGQLSLSASPREGVGMSQVEAAVQAEIDRLTGDGVTLDEVARAKARMRAAAVYARDSLQTGAQVLGYALVVGQNVEDVEEWPERIGAVTAADVTEAARLVLTRSQNATGILLPDPGERDKK
ncbi:MAG: insulinase family protein, partial [Alphaproteobacteria bacterium]|nr:insulinase family protein [Alphaproteobacteria bacterium]